MSRNSIKTKYYESNWRRLAFLRITQKKYATVCHLSGSLRMKITLVVHQEPWIQFQPPTANVQRPKPVMGRPAIKLPVFAKRISEKNQSSESLINRLSSGKMHKSMIFLNTDQKNCTSRGFVWPSSGLTPNFVFSTLRRLARVWRGSGWHFGYSCVLLDLRI